MFKVVFVMHERAGMDRAAALKHWGTTHADIVRAVPGVRRYVQYHAVAGLDGDAPFLGTAEIAFDNEAAYDAAVAGPEFAAALEDVPNFADETAVQSAVAEDVIVV